MAAAWGWPDQIVAGTAAAKLLGRHSLRRALCHQGHNLIPCFKSEFDVTVRCAAAGDAPDDDLLRPPQSQREGKAEEGGGGATGKGDILLTAVATGMELR